MKSLRFFQMVGCIVLCAGFVSADSLELRNGRHIQGKYVGGTTNAIGFMTSGSVEYFSTTDIVALVFDNSPDASFNGIQPNATAPNLQCPRDPQATTARKTKQARSAPRLQRAASHVIN